MKIDLDAITPNSGDPYPPIPKTGVPYDGGDSDYHLILPDDLIAALEAFGLIKKE